MWVALFFLSPLFPAWYSLSMIALPILSRMLVVVALFLFVVPVSHAASGEPDQLSAESGARSGTQTDAPSEAASEAPPAPAALPEACPDCGLPYYRPSTTKSNAAAAPEQAASEERPKATSGAPASIELESTSGRAHLSSDPRVRTARALVHNNRFAAALEILRPLAPDHPDQEDVRFLLGLAASRGSQEPSVGEETRVALLDEAIAAFRSILIHKPGLVRVRLELALAFFLKEDDDLALDHFERVLVGEPPAPVLAKIRSFLNVMRARRRLTGYFGFSVAPDTNINAASDAQFIYINGLPFRRSTQSQASSDIGVVGWGGAEYQYPLADRWRLRAGFNVNHREYKGNRFDQTFLSGYVGPRFFVSRTTEMSLLASASQRWWGGSSFNYDLGARLEVLHRPLPGLRLNGQGTWQDRKYQQNRGLEGPLMVFSLGASYVLFPTVQVNGLVGYSQQDSKADRWDSTGYWTRVGTNVALPWGFTVGASAEFRWTDYESGWFPFIPDNTTPRSDQTRILQATLLNRAITVYGFSPQIAFSNQVRESNAQVFDYKRNLVEMRWVRQF